VHGLGHQESNMNKHMIRMFILCLKLNNENVPCSDKRKSTTKQNDPFLFTK
jgi:hypothetical protein